MFYRCIERIVGRFLPRFDGIWRRSRDFNPLGAFSSRTPEYQKIPTNTKNEKEIFYFSYFPDHTMPELTN
ncbi:MAG TPA: hypothetical protein DCS88_11355 [Alphaproteobacteria bacterium]|nr:hypothetical protein [Alphaproteobacteria bacterium]